jgi:class 3 adenylate cyclase
MLAAHIPPDLVSRLNRENTRINPSGELKKITVMFVDMRGFSQLLEKYDAKRVLKLLDIYFRMLVSIVRKHDGIVDKFIGDGLMAVWGIPHRKKSDVYNAIRAAVEIRIGMFRIIPELVSVGEVPLEIGIGVGTGDAVTGFIGPSTWKEYTLVGNCINRAARLQAMASDNRIFIDANTAREARTFSYLLNASSKPAPHVLKEMRTYEIEGLCEYNQEFGHVRKHPRLVTAKVAGITNVNLQRRKPVLVKSIGEGGMGIEVHDFNDFTLDIGDEAVVDSLNLSLLNRESTRGYVVRKQEITGGGIYRIKTWDVGVKFFEISEEVRRRLLKVFVGNEQLQQIVGASAGASDTVTWP